MQIGSELRLQTAPFFHRDRVELNGPGDLVGEPAAILDETPLELEVQRARVLARRAGVELAGFHHNHTRTGFGEVPGGRAADQTPANDEHAPITSGHLNRPSRTSVSRTSDRPSAETSCKGGRTYPPGNPCKFSAAFKMLGPDPKRPLRSGKYQSSWITRSC